LELPAYPQATDAGAALTAGPTVRRSPSRPQPPVSGQFDLDLANLPLTIGDVLTIVVVAKDTGGS